MMIDFANLKNNAFNDEVYDGQPGLLDDNLEFLNTVDHHEYLDT